MATSRKTWLGTAIDAQPNEIDEYQQSLRGREDRLPIFDTGDLYVVVLPSDSEAKVARTLEGRTWVARPHWKDASVIVYQYASKGGTATVPLKDMTDSQLVDTYMALFGSRPPTAGRAWLMGKIAEGRKRVSQGLPAARDW